MKRISVKELAKRPDEILSKIAHGEQQFAIDHHDVLFELVPIPPEEEMVDVELELEDEAWLLIAKEAHKLDITINQWIVRQLQNFIRKPKQYRERIRKAQADPKTRAVGKIKFNKVKTR